MTVEEYHKMAEAGILKEEDRVELLEGKIITMSPIGSRHAACVEKIDELLKRSLSGKAMVRTQNPVLIGNFSEPKPDVAGVKKKDNYYADQHPVADEIFLIIEVADSSLEKDRQAKLPIYAGAGIPVYWIVNLEKKELEVYQSPMGNQYFSRQTFSADEQASLPEFGFQCPVRSLLI